MIRFFLLLLLALAASWFLADTLEQKGPGYAYIYYDNYSIETSFWLLMALILGFIATIFTLFYATRYGLRLLIKTAFLPHHVGMRRSRKKHQTAVLAYLEHDWSTAAADMSRALKKVETPFIANLLILQAQLKRGDIAAAQLAYQAAQDSDDYDELSLLLAGIDIRLADGQLLEAEQIVKNLLIEYSLDVRVVLKALRVFQAQGNVVAMEPLIKSAKKQQLLSELELEQWQQQFYRHQIQSALVAKDTSALKKLWRKCQKLDDDELSKAFFTAFAEVADVTMLEKLLLQHLKKHWQDELLLIYAACDAQDHAKQLDVLEALLPQHAESTYLLQALAIICQKSQLWGKARDYLLQSLAITPTVDAYQLLAEVYAEHGEPDKQLQCLQAGLSLAHS